MKKVLVVEENQLIIKTVELYLSSYGYNVGTCRTSSCVHNKVREFEPDLILMDFQMPGLQGKNVDGVVQRMQWNEGCKTVFFSSEHPNTLQKMVDDGIADGYYYKGRSFEGIPEYISRFFDEPGCTGKRGISQN